MEDRDFDVPGAFTNAVTTSAFHPWYVDSVDGDDGAAADGMCRKAGGLSCESLFYTYGQTGIRIDFNPQAFRGVYPTHVGIVWTDGDGQVSFEAFGADGGLIGVVGPVSQPGFPDSNFSGGTTEDRFFGVSDPAGISMVRLSNSTGGIEADHVQFGRFP